MTTKPDLPALFLAFALIPFSGGELLAQACPPGDRSPACLEKKKDQLVDRAKDLLNQEAGRAGECVGEGAPVVDLLGEMSVTTERMDEAGREWGRQGRWNPGSGELLPDHPLAAGFRAHNERLNARREEIWTSIRPLGQRVCEAIDGAYLVDREVFKNIATDLYWSSKKKLQLACTGELPRAPADRVSLEERVRRAAPGSEERRRAEEEFERGKERYRRTLAALGEVEASYAEARAAAQRQLDALGVELTAMWEEIGGWEAWEELARAEASCSGTAG